MQENPQEPAFGGNRIRRAVLELEEQFSMTTHMSCDITLDLRPEMKGVKSLQNPKNPKLDFKLHEGVLQTKDTIAQEEHVVQPTVPAHVLALLIRPELSVLTPR